MMVTAPVGSDVAAFMGKPEDATTVTTADAQLPVVTAFVYGYTRGRGFITEDSMELDLRHVIVSACARLVHNPEHTKRYQVGDYSEAPAVLDGFTLPELAILHRYRRRTA